MTDLHLIDFNGPKNQGIYIKVLNGVPTKNTKQQIQLPFFYCNIGLQAWVLVAADTLSPSIFHHEELK